MQTRVFLHLLSFTNVLYFTWGFVSYAWYYYVTQRNSTDPFLQSPVSVLRHIGDIFHRCVTRMSFYRNHTRFTCLSVDGIDYTVKTPPDWKRGSMTDTHKVKNFMSYNYLGTNRTIEPPKEEYDGTEDGLKRLLVRFMKKKHVSVFSTGYLCNIIGLCLAIQYEYECGQEGGRLMVFSEAENHASIVRGIKRAQKQMKVPFDLRIFRRDRIIDDVLFAVTSMDAAKKPAQIIIVGESLYSMSGEFMPMDDLEAVKSLMAGVSVKVYLDAAHSFGCVGEDLAGIPVDGKLDVVDYFMCTTTKSFASMGGVIASNDGKFHEFVDSYVRSSPYLTRQLTMPKEMRVQIAGVLCRLLLNKEENKLQRRRIEHVCRVFKSSLRSNGVLYKSSENSPVVMIPLKKLSDLIHVHRKVFQRGFLVAPACYPAVPLDEVYMRICLSVLHTETDLWELARTLSEIIQ